MTFLQWTYPFTNYPETASILDKYRVNPGNVGSADNKNFSEIINIAKNNNKAIRIGGNWGSLSKSYLEKNSGGREKVR